MRLLRRILRRLRSASSPMSAAPGRRQGGPRLGRAPSRPTGVGTGGHPIIPRRLVFSGRGWLLVPRISSSAWWPVRLRNTSSSDGRRRLEVDDRDVFGVERAERLVSAGAAR